MEKARYANDVNLANIKSDSLINFTLQQYFSGQLAQPGQRPRRNAAAHR